MDKLDLTKQHKAYYSARPIPEILSFEAARYISIEGRGDPSGPLFAEHLQALYSIAYALKFKYKGLGQDFAVPKLEGLWDFNETKYGGIPMEEAPIKIPRSEWNYRLLIRMPDVICVADVEDTRSAVKAKKAIRYLDNVGIFKLPAQKVVQMLHVGPYSKEPETLFVMKKFIDEHGFGRGGAHHEIYLSDHRKTAPEKLRTILREPVLSL